MKTSMVLSAALAVSGVGAAAATTAEREELDRPEHQVVAIYFHRTQRCPTCKRIGAMAEEAFAKGFRNETKDRVV